MWKIGAAKAAQGADLDEVIRAAQKAVDHTSTAGIGITACTIPAVGHPNFEVKEGTMEVGIGLHGEPGIEVCELKSANEMAQLLLEIILPDQPIQSGDEVAVMVSGLGATPLMEQYIFFNRVEEVLSQKGIQLYRSYVGTYFSSLDMMGVQLCLMKLDDELKELLDMEVNSMGLKQFAR
jgi:dihydroxyacetone kinase-like protein